MGRWLLVDSLALFGLGLTQTPIATDAVSAKKLDQPNAAVARCGTVAALTQGLREQRLPRAEDDIAIVAGSGLSFESATLFTGPCAQTLRGVRASSFEFEGPVTFGRTTEGFTKWRNGVVFSGSLLTNGPSLPNKSARFVMAAPAPIPVKPNQPSLYMGVWRSRDRSILAAFRRRRNGSFSRPEIVATLASPIASITFFPSIDSPAGTLTATSEPEKSSRRVLRLTWTYSDMEALSCNVV